MMGWGDVCDLRTAYRPTKSDFMPRRDVVVDSFISHSVSNPSSSLLSFFEPHVAPSRGQLLCLMP